MMTCSEVGADPDWTAKMAGDRQQRRWAAGKKALEAAIDGGARVATSYEPAEKRMQSVFNDRSRPSGDDPPCP